MKLAIKLLIFSLLAFISSSCGREKGKHLFILAGQSNMVRMDPKETFIPALTEVFGEDKLIIVKEAMGAQPIRRWYKNWQPPEGTANQGQADLYDSLMNKVTQAIYKEKLATITFIWMQGERDAREQLADVYENSLNGLYSQLSQDLGRRDINFIIGRLSDYDLNNEKYPHWSRIREIQEGVADSNPRFAWINTDDLNDGVNDKGDTIVNDLHMSVEGYKKMGKRFAEKAIFLILEKN